MGVTFFPYLKILLQFAITMCAITTMFSNDFSDEKETVVVLEYHTSLKRSGGAISMLICDFLSYITLITMGRKILAS